MTSQYRLRSIAALATLALPFAVFSCSGAGGDGSHGGDGDGDGIGANDGSGAEGAIQLPEMGGNGASSGNGNDPIATCDVESEECHYELVDAGPACGDGEVTEGEECDDGNTFPGDGCTGVCVQEPYSDCPAEGGPCTSTIICGDGSRGPGETCDDGNQTSGDGCSDSCRTEPGFYCPEEGKKCQQLVSCGDGAKQPGEACDDGNKDSGDGCSSLCSVESGWRCIFYPTGMQCEELPVCGNGLKEGIEECDDNNDKNGDGCSASCKVEASYWDCSAVGVPCTSLVSCGDGLVEDRETCDDGNTNGGDGCSAACRVSAGWVCPVPGQKCVPRCGDGLVTSAETCDDGNKTSGDGCSSTCQREPGFVCTVTGGNGGSCKKTVCGDGIVEGGEQCDKGALNGLILGDGSGCTLTCTDEPVCRNGAGVNQACAVTCGDGVRDASEQCDDGNRSNGDGCSASCQMEAGYECSDLIVEDTVNCPTGGGKCLVLPITYRDFKSRHFPNGHDDFFYLGASQSDGTQINNVPDTVCEGMTLANLGANGKPVLATTNFSACVGTFPLVKSSTSFSQWYTDTAASKKTIGTLALRAQVNGTFQFSATGGTQFFPLDNNMKWADEQKICGDWPYGNCSSNTHNYHFTSEVRYLFPFSGGEQLTFSGDDDVWVFVNGQRAIDLGGVHQNQSRTVTLNNGNYGMTVGKIYEIVVFHAERHPVGSNYTLTLNGFSVRRSVCQPDCGDGIATITEECDNGVNNGSYGTCKSDCTFAPRCGDGAIQASQGEFCDDGVNQSVSYNAPPPACGPGCVQPPHCGDNIIQSVSGELCDDGPNNSNSTYGACSTTCSLGAFCGDALIQSGEGEQCDDGLNIGGYGQCGVGCKLGPRCGDGIVQPGEVCDDGNEISGDGCNPGCGLAPQCGDGIIQPEAGEECDDGINDGSYGGCSVDCMYGPRCGDGVPQAQYGEICDLGDDKNSNTLYGGCTKTCGLAPHCGDGKVQSGTSEQCDDGNNKSNDGCSSNCRKEVLVVK